MNNFDKFNEVFAFFLEESILKDPGSYAWEVEDLPGVLHRMRIALDRGTYSNEGRAFKLTCKHFGLRPSYQAVNEFLKAPHGKA